MQVRFGFGALLPLLLCSACLRYHPQPLDPPSLESGYRARSLADPGLRAFIEANAGVKPLQWPPAALDLDSMTLVSLYFNPDMEVARLRISVADAGVLAAGGRPNPPTGGAAGHTGSPESPYVFKFSFELPIESAGKRRYRILRAQQLTEAARLALGETAWQVRSRVRAAFVEHLLAIQELDLLARTEKAQQEAVALYERRLAVGEIARPLLDAARTELLGTRMLIHGARGKTEEARVAMASALGLGPKALAGVPCQWPSLDAPPDEGQLPLAAIQRGGLLNRLDVQRALSEYAAAETTVRLEVAKQYPDIHLAPGYEFGEGHNSYFIGPNLLLPLLNRNRGAIAEAEAQRKEAAARFLSLQASVIDEMERALIRYRAAFTEHAQAGAALALLESREKAMRRLLAAGEADRLELVGLRLQSAAAERLRLEALRRLQAALGALEDAVQRPLDGALPLPPPAP